jgi:type I restriction enzyme S subunit
MIAHLKPYPKMKDSGASWLGKMPEHWVVRRTRNAADMRVSNIDKHTKEGELSVRLCNYVDVYKNDRITERVSFMRATAMAEEIERFRMEPGDVLITKDSESWSDIGVPALVEYTAEDLVCGYHLALMRPRKGVLNGAYLLRALQSPAVAYQFHIAANGVTRYGLSHDAIKSVLLPIPPLPEQAAIVRYLDYMDRRIRKYIRAKQKLIKLLEEQKQAITHDALRLAGTRSLRIGSAAEIVGQPIDRQPDQVYTPIGLYNRGRGIFHKTPTKGSELGESTFFWLTEGDLVLSGQFAWEGAIALAGHEDDGCVASHRYPVLRGKPDVVESAYYYPSLRQDGARYSWIIILGGLLVETGH